MQDYFVKVFSTADINIYIENDFNNLENFLVSYSLPGIYLFKVNTRNTRVRCEICSKLTIRTPE